MAAIAATVAIAYLTMRYYTNPRVPSAQYGGHYQSPWQITFQYHVCSLLLSGKGGRQSVPPPAPHTCTYIADKTNFEPPDEIRHTGCEFVIP
ncbi:unnamed protein product [Lasius platythorax]|uniref:Secreted protein n=1 Tax=Lasius platythorax TaxID=488582 RepID=A0AAV2NV34_9HYME